MKRVLLRKFAIFDILWQGYIDTDYGRKVPEKGYKGFRTYVIDELGINVVGPSPFGLAIKFDSDEEYVMFKLQYG
tara:strand:- start:204 stop:428 length:225 start_codon:yes stop_codon:yes gene_type:complete